MRRPYPDHAYHPDPPPSYWASTIPEATTWRTPLERDLSVDFAVVGAGFTGLNAALALAERGEDVAVFDGSYPGWGASGRNGGFVCVGGTKLDYADQIAKFGEAETRDFVSRQLASIDHVADILERFEIDADRHSDGEWALAHSPKAFERMKGDAEAERRLGLTVNRFSKDEAEERGIRSPLFHGAQQVAHGFAINPLKYAHGLAKATEAAGAAIHSHSPVHSIRSAPGGFRLHVGGFQVRAKKLIVALNGYAADGFVAGLTDRVMPVLSSIIVTRPLTGDEIQAQGFTTDQAVYDTRSRVHYLRLLPEGRLMFGARGGSSLHPWMMARLRKRIRADFEAMFPAWRHVEATHEWNGLLALAWSKTMYVGPLGDWLNAWTGFGYHGNGVAMGSYTGKLLAELATGDLRRENLPALLRQPLKRFPFPRLRMGYVKGYYAAWDIGEKLRG